MQWRCVQLQWPDRAMRYSEQVRNHLFAVGLTLAALAVRWSLQPLLGPLQPYAPGIAAIAAVATLTASTDTASTTMPLPCCPPANNSLTPKVLNTA